MQEKKGEVFFDEDDMMPDEEQEQVDPEPKLSKKARKARDKLSVAELKVWIVLWSRNDDTHGGGCFRPL